MDVKTVFARNLNFYMEANGKSRKDLCDALGLSYYTVSDWANGKKYPRMDKVDKLADYFGITKADLIEEKIPATLEDKQDFLVNVIVRLQTDSDFYSYIEDIMALSPSKIPILRQMLDNFHVFAK